MHKLLFSLASYFMSYEFIKYFFVLHIASTIHATGAIATHTMKKV